MATPGTIRKLPFKAERLSFAAKWSGDATGPDSPVLDLHLSTVAFDREGKFIGAASSAQYFALGNSLRHLSGVHATQGDDAFDADEVIHMLPNEVVPECEVVLVVLSAAKNPVQVSDLNTPPQLTFGLHIIEKDKPRELLLGEDLKQYVSQPTPAATALTNGNQSLVVCALYRAPEGWTAQFLQQSFTKDNWGALLPELKGVLRTLPDLYAAEKAAVDPTEKVAVIHKLEDRSLLELANSNIAEGAAATPVTKLRIEIGWSIYGKDEEELEEWAPEYALYLYNAQGEEVAAINTDNAEGDGFKVGLPEPEEADEDEPPEASDAGNDDDDADGDNDDDGDDGDKEGGQEPPPEPEPKEPEPAIPAFPLKDRIDLELEVLPKDVRNMMLVFANFGGSGLRHVKSVHVRALDITHGEEDAAARPLLEYRVDSRREQDAAISALLLLKVYKEASCSAFSRWAASGTPTLEAFFKGKPVKQALLDVLAAAKERIAKEEAQRKANEEDGEEGVVDLREFEWRVRLLDFRSKGESLTEGEVDEALKNLCSYEGRLDAEGTRTDSRAKAAYANNDTYFGAYAADAKNGLGLYLFANGAGYCGSYRVGKREGAGIMVFPDKGVYQGQFVADKFHGEGRFDYPDGSSYMGSWSAGKKHGAGVYWDAQGGCLQGTWHRGVLKGDAQYDQREFTFRGAFLKGLPAGPCTFTASAATRTAGLPQLAAAHTLADYGPALTATSEYTLPPGVAVDDSAEPADGDDGADAADGQEDGDQPPLPAFPKYEGLAFQSSATETPKPAIDPVYPPPGLTELPGQFGLVH